MNDYKEEISELTMEIMALAFAIHTKTDYAVFIDFQGHCDLMRIDIRKSATDYTEEIASTEFRLIPYSGNPTEEEYKHLMESLKEKRDILKVSASDGELDFSSMQEVAHTTYTSAF